MKKTPRAVRRHSVTFEDGTCWPLPERDDDDSGTAAHRLRYQGADFTFTMTDRFHASEVLSVYELLIAMPLAESRLVLSALKAAVAMRRSNKP